uniref:Poly(A) RNA polymerase mitochondrial-like central palm domain-containing protein n=1 Tax=Hyaloperonospora arabidopsidis (strain Emoy2) TaxID=559515 RepID=M4BXS4_HYAAE
MGAANSVRKLTVDSIALLEQLEPTRAEVAAKRAVRRCVQHLLQEQWPTCRVLPFGSSERSLTRNPTPATLKIEENPYDRPRVIVDVVYSNDCSNLGFGGCDVDLAIYFHDGHVNALGELPLAKRVELLTTARERLSRTFQVQAFVRSARVPVLKLWDPKRERECAAEHGAAQVLRTGGSSRAAAGVCSQVLGQAARNQRRGQWDTELLWCGRE